MKVVDKNGRRIAMSTSFIRTLVFLLQTSIPVISWFSWVALFVIAFTDEKQGLHDFAAFQITGCNWRNSLTSVQDVSIVRHGDIVTVEIQASGFLYGMVRLLMGQLVAVGEKRLSLEKFIFRCRTILLGIC